MHVYLHNITDDDFIVISPAGSVRLFWPKCKPFDARILSRQAGTDLETAAKDISVCH